MKTSGLSSGTRSLYELWNRLRLNCVYRHHCQVLWQISKQQLYRSLKSCFWDSVTAYLPCTQRYGQEDYDTRSMPGHEDSLILPPLANAPVVACPNLPMLRNLKPSLSIPLKFPHTVAGRGEVIRFYVSGFSCAQALP
ncbi:hypothetical protein EDD85DRAFT_1027283 [Armillaria nabsnona]|nr:hypothetical protein EDD85DRAFT_1027283 [Armillaria nabsnona]